MKVKPRQVIWVVLAILSITLWGSPMSGQALPSEQTSSPGPWWGVTPEPEVPSPFYDSILYSEIAPKLREIEQNSNRVRVEVIGQSFGGRNLFLVTLSAPEALGRLGQYQAIRQTLLKDPEKAQEIIDRLGDFKVPVFINGSIHGNEYPGVDAALRLIEKLAYEDSDEVRQILDNVILLVNVVLELGYPGKSKAGLIRQANSILRTYTSQATCRDIFRQSGITEQYLAAKLRDILDNGSNSDKLKAIDIAAKCLGLLKDMPTEGGAIIQVNVSIQREPDYEDGVRASIGVGMGREKVSIST